MVSIGRQGQRAQPPGVPKGAVKPCNQGPQDRQPVPAQPGAIALLCVQSCLPCGVMPSLQNAPGSLAFAAAVQSSFRAGLCDELAWAAAPGKERYQGSGSKGAMNRSIWSDCKLPTRGLSHDAVVTQCLISDKPKCANASSMSHACYVAKIYTAQSGAQGQLKEA